MNNQKTLEKNSSNIIIEQNNHYIIQKNDSKISSSNIIENDKTDQQVLDINAKCALLRDQIGVLFSLEKENIRIEKLAEDLQIQQKINKKLILISISAFLYKNKQKQEYFLMFLLKKNKIDELFSQINHNHQNNIEKLQKIIVLFLLENFQEKKILLDEQNICVMTSVFIYYVVSCYILDSLFLEEKNELILEQLDDSFLDNIDQQKEYKFLVNCFFDFLKNYSNLLRLRDKKQNIYYALKSNYNQLQHICLKSFLDVIDAQNNKQDINKQFTQTLKKLKKFSSKYVQGILLNGLNEYMLKNNIQKISSFYQDLKSMVSLPNIKDVFHYISNIKNNQNYCNNIMHILNKHWDSFSLELQIIIFRSFLKQIPNFQKYIINEKDVFFDICYIILTVLTIAKIEINHPIFSYIIDSYKENTFLIFSIFEVFSIKFGKELSNTITFIKSNVIRPVAKHNEREKVKRLLEINKEIEDQNSFNFIYKNFNSLNNTQQISWLSDSF